MTDTESKPIEDMEEAFRVVQQDETHFVGAHPLRLPLPAARGVYGGHTVAQTLRVAIESAPGYRPQAFHSYFILAGKATVPMEYEVTKLNEDGADVAKRSIRVLQYGKVRFVALVTLVKRGVERTSDHLDIQRPPAQSHYNDPAKMHNLAHTDYIRNAYDDKFVDYKLTPEEDAQDPADRWINVFSGVVQKNAKFQDAASNFVAVADLSDSVFLTTLARILHAPWNPTETNAFQEVDLQKDARMWMNISLNVLHIFHYNAMSLDHHIYFHSDCDEFDLARDWLSFTYQARRVSNNRTLVRGHMYNKHGKQVVTVAQEGLTFGFNGFDKL